MSLSEFGKEAAKGEGSPKDIGAESLARQVNIDSCFLSSARNLSEKPYLDTAMPRSGRFEECCMTPGKKPNPQPGSGLKQSSVRKLRKS